MAEFIETALNERRSLEQALAEIASKYDRTPPGQTRDGLARMIQQIEVEIARRRAGPSRAKWIEAAAIGLPLSRSAFLISLGRAARGAIASNTSTISRAFLPRGDRLAGAPTFEERAALRP